MLNINYRVELRKPKAAIKDMRNWQESATFQTLVEANDRITWSLQYDEYYSCVGWEYRIVEVKARKR